MMEWRIRFIIQTNGNELTLVYVVNKNHRNQIEMFRELSKKNRKKLYFQCQSNMCGVEGGLHVQHTQGFLEMAKISLMSVDSHHIKYGLDSFRPKSTKKLLVHT